MYKLIYADPPWKYSNKASNGAANKHYETTDLYSLTRLSVEKIADKNAVLCMWYTGNFAREAELLAEAWGFKVKTALGFIWVKLNKNTMDRVNASIRKGELFDAYDFMDLLNTETRMNGGNYTRSNGECCLIAVRGQGLERVSASVKQIVYSCLGEHSEKPAEVRHRLEQLYGDVPRIELFARQQTTGWHTWGNECICDIEL